MIAPGTYKITFMWVVEGRCLIITREKVDKTMCFILMNWCQILLPLIICPIPSNWVEFSIWYKLVIFS